jgi:hypothetical protein
VALLTATGGWLGAGPGATAHAGATTTDTTTFVPVQRATPQQVRSDATTISKRLTVLGYAVHVAVTKNGIVVRRDSGNVPSSALQAATMIGNVFFRPVLCFAPLMAKADRALSSSGAAAPLPACGASYAATAANLAVGPAGQSAIPTPDPQFARLGNTSTATPGYRARAVLLPGLPSVRSEGTGPRYVLGPSQMSGSAVASARVQRDQTGQWVVDFTMTRAGATLFDQVARASFHLFLAVDLDGVVQSAPLIQPSQTSFTSFDGRGEISGDLTKAAAQKLALALSTKPLAVRLEVP